MTIERYLVVSLSPAAGMRARKWCHRVTPLLSTLWAVILLPVFCVYRGSGAFCSIRSFIDGDRTSSFDALISLYNVELVAYVVMVVLVTPIVVVALVVKIISIEKKRLARDGENDSAHIRIALELVFIAVYTAICVSLNIFWMFKGTSQY